MYHYCRTKHLVAYTSVSPRGDQESQSPKRDNTAGDSRTVIIQSSAYIAHPNFAERYPSTMRLLLAPAFAVMAASVQSSRQRGVALQR